MTLEEFIAKYPVGTKVDFDKVYGAQCVDLFRQYCHDVWNTPHLGGVSGAKDLWLRYNELPAEQKYLERIKNPWDIRPGDVLIWDKSPANPYGHVAICVQVYTGSFRVMEQDGFAQKGVESKLRTADNLLGALRIRKEI